MRNPLCYIGWHSWITITEYFRREEAVDRVTIYEGGTKRCAHCPQRTASQKTTAVVSTKQEQVFDQAVRESLSFIPE